MMKDAYFILSHNIISESYIEIKIKLIFIFTL